MKKRSLLLCLALVLSLTMAIGGTLAYLTDTEYDTNVMTLGNVDIAIEEVFDQYKLLYPAVITTAEDGTETVTGAITKEVYVKNGEKASPAYVRTILAFPAVNGKYVTLTGDSPIILKYNTETFTGKILEVQTTIGEQPYTLFVFTYEKALASGERSEASLLSFYMNPNVTNEDLKGFNGGYRVDVAAQAVQVENMKDAAQALYLGFGAITEDSHPWKENGLPAKPPIEVNDIAGLQSALTSGADNVVLASTMAIDGDTALDLNGKTLTIPAGTTGFAVSNGAALTLANGEVKVGGGDKAEAITVTNTEEGKTTTLNLENVEMTFDAYTDGDGDSVSTAIVAEAESGNVVVNIGEGTNIASEAQHSAPVVVGKNATVVMDGGVINASQSGEPNSWTSLYGVKLTDATSVFTMNGGTINADGTNSCSGIYASKGTVYMNGGTINVLATGNKGYSIGIEAGKTATLNLNGGTINVKSPGAVDAEAIDIGVDSKDKTIHTTVNYDSNTSAFKVYLYKNIWNGNRVSEDELVNNIITGIEINE